MIHLMILLQMLLLLILIDSQLVSHESRLATLEQKPASRMERILWYALCALLGAAATAVADWWITVA